LTVDDDAELDYTQPALKKIFSRWIPFGGRSIATRLNDVLLSRYRNPPRRINYQLMLYNQIDPTLGGGYQLEAYCFQDDTGAREDFPIQVTRLNVKDAIIEVEAEEMRFAGDENPSDHVIIIDANVNDVNLRTLHDTLYSSITGGQSVTVVIQAGIIVGASSTSNRALDIGSWPASVTISLTGEGRIEGKGGNGSINSNGQAGGVALYTRYAISIDMDFGQIWGGGGGGGGTLAGTGTGGGGGGAGQTPGLGAAPGGADGTTETGGARGAATAGNGGNPGTAGGNGNFTTGGAAGAAIDGVSFVTIVNSPDIQGSQIN